MPVGDPLELVVSLILVGILVAICVQHAFAWLFNRTQILNLLFSVWMLFTLAGNVVNVYKVYTGHPLSNHDAIMSGIFLVTPYFTWLMVGLIVYGDVTRLSKILLIPIALATLGVIFFPLQKNIFIYIIRFGSYLYLAYLFYQGFKLKREYIGFFAGGFVLYALTVTFFGLGSFSVTKDYPVLGRTLHAIGFLVSLNLYSAYLAKLSQLRDKKAAENELLARSLADLDKLKSRFFANVSHEFRTPLTLIQGPADELLKSTDNEVSRTHATLIRNNSKRLLKLVNRLLTMAKLDAKEMKLNYTRTDLNKFLRITFAQFQTLADSKSIQFNWNISSPPTFVSLDEEKCEAILNNLVSNALKFTPTGGSVNIIANLAGDMLHVSVTDTGPGIPHDQLNLIFDRFYQVDPTNTTHAEGTGIGLALVKEYAELMNGRVSVESDPGKKTTFHVRWKVGPVADSPIEQTTEEPDRAEVAIDTIADVALPLILIVEDNADIRSFLQHCLGTSYRYHEAAHGRKGLDMARALVPDIIISDLMMPEMDGVTLCREIKTDPRTNHIPLIMLTAIAADATRLEGLRTGADDYLVKPFNKGELTAKVQNLITLRKNLQQKIRNELLAQATPIQATSAEEQFVLKAKQYIEGQLSDETLSVESLAAEMGLSREQCYRKMMSLTGLSPSALIRKLRLQKASKLLLAKWGPVSQVAYEVGFNNLSHFSKSFKEEFGQLPSDYTG